MTRTSDILVARRINGAVILIKKRFSDARIILILMKRYGVSRRQAYRYLREAQTTKKVLPLPEKKIHFTVKLPRALVQRLRQFLRSDDESLSSFVTRAVTFFLQREGHG